MKTYHLGGVVLAAGLILAACNAATPQSSGGSGYATGTADAQVSASTTVQAAQSKLGRILVDAQGRTLYTFTNDKNGSSTCYGACADAWPSVAANGARCPDRDSTRRCSRKRRVPTAPRSSRSASGRCTSMQAMAHPETSMARAAAGHGLSSRPTGRSSRTDPRRAVSSPQHRAASAQDTASAASPSIVGGEAVSASVHESVQSVRTRSSRARSTRHRSPPRSQLSGGFRPGIKDHRPDSDHGFTISLATPVTITTAVWPQDYATTHPGRVSTGE